MIIQAFVIPASRLAYLKATVMSAAKLGSSRGSCNISNTASQELEVDKMVLSFEVTAAGITESTMELLKGFGINASFGSEKSVLQPVCGEFNFG